MLRNDSTLAEWLVLADDLTGANDSGVALARRGLETLSALTPGPLPPADAWVVSTNSRALPPAAAAEQVRAALRGLVELPGGLYKKIDSALRGNPAMELLALVEAADARRVLIAPALPAQGRSVMGGRVYWKGLALDQTEFGGQIRTSDLFELFRPLGARLPLRRLGLELVRGGAQACADQISAQAVGAWIADAGEDADLDVLYAAARMAGVDVLCGSAGLANALARALPPRVRRSEAPRAGQGPALLAAGSRSRVAAGQVEYALRGGAALLELPQDFVETGKPGCLEGLLKQARAVNGPLVLSLHGLADDPARAELYIARLGAAAAELARQLRAGGLVLTGGDTAAAVCAALGARLLRLEGETEPGVAWGRLLDGGLPGLALVTKAGSFGGEETLLRALHFVEEAGG